MLIKQSVLYLIGRLAPALIYFALIAFYTRLLTPTEYGHYAFAFAMASLLTSVFFQWLISAAMRLGEHDADREGIRWGIFVGFAGAVLLALCGVLIACAIVQDRADRMLIMGGAALFFASGWFELNAAFLAAELKAGQYAIYNSLRALLSGALGGYFGWQGFGAAGILTGMAIGTAMPAVLLTLKQLKGFKPWPAHWSALRRVTDYGFPLMLGYAVGNINYNTDRFTIAALRGATNLGHYFAGFDLADRVIKSLVTPIGAAALPVAVKALANGGIPAAREQLKRNVVLLAAIAVPASLGLVAVSRELVDVVIGPEFREASRKIVPIIAVALLIWSVRANYLDHAFQLGLQTKRGFVVYLSAALTNIALCVPLVMWLGIEGAAYSCVAAQFVAFALCLRIGRRAFPLPFPAKELSKVFGAGLLMLGALSLVPHAGPLPLLVLKTALGAIIYCTVLVTLNVAGTRRLFMERVVPVFALRR